MFVVNEHLSHHLYPDGLSNFCFKKVSRSRGFLYGTLGHTLFKWGLKLMYDIDSFTVKFPKVTVLDVRMRQVQKDLGIRVQAESHNTQ